MPTYAERMRLGQQAAIAAGIDPKLAAVYASQYAPKDEVLPNPWSRGVEDTPMLVQGVKDFASRLFGGAKESMEQSSFNPFALGQRFGQTAGPAIMGIPQELSRALETPREQAARAAAAPKPAAAVAASRPQPQPGRDQTVRPENVFDINGMVSWAKQQGAAVTSTKRSAGKNAAVGGVGNSYHLTGQAFDSVAPKGQNMAQWAATLRSQFPNADVINEGDHVHVEPMSRGQAMAKEYMPNFQNPFDPSLVNAALGEVNRGTAAAMQPTELSFDRNPMPEMPAPVLPERTDWSKADQALAKLEPAVMTEKEAQRIKRSSFFQGIAQAMAATPDGAGLGKVLGMLGAGAMGGAAAGDKELQARLDAFDEKMARYNVAVYQHEQGKAKTIAEEARYEAATLNQFGMQKWKAQYDDWASMAQPAITADAIITRRIGADGKMEVKRTPIASAVMAEGAYKRASILAGASGEANAGARMQAQAVNGMLGNIAGVMMQQDLAKGSAGDDGAEAVLGSAAFQAGSIIDSGQGPTLLGAEGWKGLSAQAVQMARQLYPEGGDAYEEAVRSHMVSELTRAALMGDKSFRDKFTEAGTLGTQIYAAERFRNRKQKQATGKRGTTTSTEYSE